MKRVTIDDVAREAGVSTSTVSRVFNNIGQIKAETRQAVQAAMERLHYRPTFAARHMAGGSSRWVSLIYHQNPGISFIHLIQTGALATCRQAGYMLSVHECQAEGEALKQEVMDIVNQLDPRGVILPAPLCIDENVLLGLRQQGVPYVRLAPPLLDKFGSPSVEFNDRQAACEMTNYLISLGHQNIAFIAGMPPNLPDFRRDGFLDAVREAGLEECEKLVKHALFNYKEAHAVARQLLKRRNRPTAIFAANDDMAAACIHAAYELQLDVPGDLSVAGFDDSYVAEILTPTLTTVHQPIADMAAAAADLLIRGAAQTTETFTLPHRLVARESTMKLARAGTIIRS